jgi:hypothetical protein
MMPKIISSDQLREIYFLLLVFAFLSPQHIKHLRHCQLVVLLLIPSPFELHDD